MKTLFSIILLLTFSVANAQDEIIDGLSSDLERNKALTLSYLETMPADQYNFRPHDSVKSFAEQFLHMARINFALAANGSDQEIMYKETNLEKEKRFHTKAEVQRLITESYDYAISHLQNLDQEHMYELVEKGSYKASRLGWFQKVHEHSTHHRGSCAIYLRALGIKPPAYQLF